MKLYVIFIFVVASIVAYFTPIGIQGTIAVLVVGIIVIAVWYGCETRHSLSLADEQELGLNVCIEFQPQNSEQRELLDAMILDESLSLDHRWFNDEMRAAGVLPLTPPIKRVGERYFIKEFVQHSYAALGTLSIDLGTLSAMPHVATVMGYAPFIRPHSNESEEIHVIGDAMVEQTVAKVEGRANLYYLCVKSPNQAVAIARAVQLVLGTVNTNPDVKID